MISKIFVFEKNNITFILDKDNKVMVNATEMAKAFHTDVWNFLRLDGTKKFIEACLKTSDLRFLNAEKNAKYRYRLQ